jgi:4-hydroxy-tetrahydrodipicolinate synthase
MITLPPHFLKGSYPPVITPFLENGAVDYTTYERIIDFQIREGSHGIVVCGTSAEPSALTLAERCNLLEAAIRAAHGRVPVVAATGSQSHAETAALTDHATRQGADALLIVTPYYIRPPQRGLAAYYNDLGRRTDLPMLMYHIPGRASVTVTLETLEQIAEVTPHFVGMKHAAIELGLVSEVLVRFGFEFRIFVGLEELSFPMLAIGACGLVNAVSNIAPRKVADLYAAVASANMAEARRLHFELYDLNRAVFFDTNPIPIKYMASKLGILPGNYHRLPMMPATPEVERRLDAVLAAARLPRTTVALGEVQSEEWPKRVG